MPSSARTTTAAAVRRRRSALLALAGAVCALLAVLACGSAATAAGGDGRSAPVAVAQAADDGSGHGPGCDGSAYADTDGVPARAAGPHDQPPLPAVLPPAPLAADTPQAPRGRLTEHGPAPPPAAPHLSSVLRV